jgi:hypothetical protein
VQQQQQQQQQKEQLVLTWHVPSHCHTNFDRALGLCTAAGISQQLSTGAPVSLPQVDANFETAGTASAAAARANFETAGTASAAAARAVDETYTVFD